MVSKHKLSQRLKVLIFSVQVRHWGARNVTLCLKTSGVPSQPPNIGLEDSLGYTRCFHVLSIPPILKSFLRSPRHIRVKSISKTEFRPILNSFFQRYFKIHLRSIYCSPVHGLMTDQVCARSIFLTQVWNIYFMCILNKSFEENNLVKINGEVGRIYVDCNLCGYNSKHEWRVN